jgi:hypothetical protein
LRPQVQQAFDNYGAGRIVGIIRDRCSSIFPAWWARAPHLNA